ncbi:MAG: helix-turn-helix transcriptional regulator [Clostridia bacterium]|nr:helix-turn-helix transcriptional regulator [Clostridia bacterium]
MFKRIRDLREDKDITQAQMADYLKIHQTTYSDYELGNLNIPIDIFIKLAEYYGTSIDYLAEVTDNPKRYK